MTLQKFISRLNWRQISIHFIASCFFVYAFKILAYLYDTKFVDHIRHSKLGQKIQGIDTDHYSSIDFVNFIRIPLYSAMVGLLIAFLIALFISKKQKWFWLNSFIAFLLAYFLYRFDYLGWDYLNNIFLSLGQLFNNSFIEFLLNGTLLLTIGLLLFFYRPLIKFVDKSK